MTVLQVIQRQMVIAEVWVSQRRFDCFTETQEDVRDQDYY